MICTYEPQAKKQFTVLIFQDELNRTSASCTKNFEENYSHFAWNVVTMSLERQRTMNSEQHTITCLPEVLGDIQKRSGKEGSFFIMITKDLTHRS